MTSQNLSSIDRIRRIVQRGQYDHVDGTFVDLFTASVIMKIYDALNEENRRKFATLPVRKMASIALKLIR